MSKQNSQAEQEEQEKVWLEIFTLFDKDGNGQICNKELGSVLRALDLDPTKKELDQAMKHLDKDGNGTITFSDFKSYMHTMKQSTVDERKEELMTAFRIIDKNGDKHLDSSELVKLLTSLGDTLSKVEAEAMIRVADINKDGKIDYEEFANFILSPYLSSNSRQPPSPLKKRRSYIQRDINCSPSSASQQSTDLSQSEGTNSSKSNFFVRGNSSMSDVSMTNVEGTSTHRNIAVSDTSVDSEYS